MKPADLFVDGLDFAKDEAELAAIVRRGFEAGGGPSPRVTQAISEAARRAAGRGALRRFWSMPRLLATAAAATVAAGTLYLNQAAPVSRSRKTNTELSVESAHGLAALLLDIQGLNEESFFMTEEAEPLWL